MESAPAAKRAAVKEGTAGETSATPAAHFDPSGCAARAEPKICCGDLEIDRIERRASLAGRPLRLTRREYALLFCLADRANRVVRRSVLLETIWTSPDARGSDVPSIYPWSNVADVYVRHLRKKFGPHAGMIETIRGIGYCLRPRARDVERAE